MAAGRKTRFTVKEAAKLVFADSSNEDYLDELCTLDELFEDDEEEKEKNDNNDKGEKLHPCPSIVVTTTARNLLARCCWQLAPVVQDVDSSENLSHRTLLHQSA